MRWLFCMVYQINPQSWGLKLKEIRLKNYLSWLFYCADRWSSERESIYDKANTNDAYFIVQIGDLVRGKVSMIRLRFEEMMTDEPQKSPLLVTRRQSDG